MNKITFTSRIRPVTVQEFSRTTFSMNKNQFVDYPWTLKESVFSNKAYTKSVADCTVCGITDGLRVLLIHLCPTNKINFDFEKVKKYICEKFDINNPDLQAILIGGKPEYSHGPNSYKLFGLFEDFLNRSKIPYSKLKGGFGTKDVAYSSTSDEWIIANNRIKRPELGEIRSPIKALENIFNEVKISDVDEVSW